jgi:hypothetical protein
VHFPYINTTLFIFNELLVLNSSIFATHLFLLPAITSGFNCHVKPSFFSSCLLHFTIDSTYRLVLILILKSWDLCFSAGFRLLCKIAESNYWLRHVCPSTRNNSTPTERIFMKLEFWVCFEILSRKFTFHWNLTKIRVMRTLHADRCTSVTLSHSVLLIIKSAADSLEEKIKTGFLASKYLFRKSWLLWDEVEKFGRAGQDTEDNITWHIPFACRINKATDKHSVWNPYWFPRQKNFAKGLNITFLRKFPLFHIYIRSYT